MDYTTIRVSTLRGDQKTNFDVFVRVNEKMILYVRKGDSFEGIRLNRLKEKKLKKLFILQDQELLYRDYIKSNIEMAYDPTSGKDLQTRAEIIQGQQQNNVEAVFEDPTSATAYETIKNDFDRYMNFLLKTDSSKSAVLGIENTDKDVAHHCVSVSTMAIVLAQKLGRTDEKQLNMMGIGALLHDLGHHNSPVPLTKKKASMSTDELTIYQSHVEKSIYSIRDKGHFDEQVVRIIAQHEELIDGSGYPNKLLEKDLDPLSVIVSTVNDADRLMTFEGVPKAEVAKKMMLTRVGQHPLNQLQLLQDVIS